MVFDDVFQKRSPAPKAAGPAGDSDPSSKRLVPDSLLAAPVDRLAAFVADLVLFLPLMALVIAPFRRVALDAQVLGQDENWATAVMSAAFGAIVAMIAFQTIFVALFGATPCKMVLKLRIVTVWDSRRPRFFEAFLRSLAWCFELCLLGIPWLAAFSNEKRRPFHDRVADTVVISLKQKRAAGPPSIAEMGIASGFQAACLMMLVLPATMQIVQSQKERASARHQAAEREEQGRLCGDVREAREDWSGSPVPSRLEVGLSMYVGKALTSECLEKESDFALWRNEDKALAYLAKGLAVATDEEASSPYFDKACDLGRSSDACFLAELVRYEARVSDPEAADDKEELARDEATLEKHLSEVTPARGPFVRVWAVQHFMDKRRYARALELMESLAPQAKLGPFLASQRAKALWSVGRREDSRVSMRASADLLDQRARVELSRWFCINDTTPSGCSTEARVSCGLVSDAVERSSQILARAEVAAAYIRGETCGGPISEERAKAVEAKLAKLPDKTARSYFQALGLIGKKRVAEALRALKPIASGKNGRGPFFVEANLRMVELAENAGELDAIRKRWLEIDPDDEGWKALGSELVQRLSALKAWDRALEVGLKIAGVEGRATTGSCARWLSRPTGRDARA